MLWLCLCKNQKNLELGHATCLTHPHLVADFPHSVRDLWLMTHPCWNVDSGDEVYGRVTDRLLPQEHKLFGVVRRHSCAIFHHGHVVLVPVLPADTTVSIAGLAVTSKRC